jgi:GH43 family beta-xylosidase
MPIDVFRWGRSVRAWIIYIPGIVLFCLGAQTRPVTQAPASRPFESPFASAKRSFTNPILPRGTDPWVIRHGAWYYYCGARGGGVFVGKSSSLQTIGLNMKTVWRPEKDRPYSHEIWAPELHFLNGKWYIYVAADDGRNENHRMYVLQAAGSDPQGAYGLVSLLNTDDRWAIDGTVLQWKGRLYFIWSGWEGTANVAQNLYIAPMDKPWRIKGTRVLISKPEFPWESNGRPLVNEGPEVLRHGSKTFIIYSASGSWTDDYCLGQLNLTGDDPLNPRNWLKCPQPVFSRTKDVFGPGHASFVNDGPRDWIVYHAAKYSGAGWNRDVRMQPFTWNRDGTPDFGAPISPGMPIEY